MWNLFRVNNKDTRTMSIDVVLMFSLLTLNRFHTLIWCFRCWLWTSKCRLGRRKMTTALDNVFSWLFVWLRYFKCISIMILLMNSWDIDLWQLLSSNQWSKSLKPEILVFYAEWKWNKKRIRWEIEYIDVMCDPCKLVFFWLSKPFHWALKVLEFSNN